MLLLSKMGIPMVCRWSIRASSLFSPFYCRMLKNNKLFLLLQILDELAPVPSLKRWFIGLFLLHLCRHMEDSGIPNTSRWFITEKPISFIEFVEFSSDWVGLMRVSLSWRKSEPWQTCCFYPRWVSQWFAGGRSRCPHCFLHFTVGC